MSRTTHAVLAVLLAFIASHSASAQMVEVKKSCTVLIGHDAFIKEGAQSDNTGGLALLRIGPDLSEGSQQTFRFFVAGDLTSACTETGQPLPVEAIVDSAYLRLFTNNGPGIDQRHDIARVVEAWSEDSVTWANQPAVEAATDSVMVTHRNRWLVEWDVTADVALFRAGTANHGWRVSMHVESYDPDGRRSEYLSSEYSNHVDAALAHPRLQIHYRLTVPRDSIGDTAVLLPNPTLDRFTVSNQCAAGVDVYQMPYGRNKLLVGKDLAGQISGRDLSDSLLFLDHADERFAEIFGYAYTQDVPAREPEVRLCHEINNAGTDNRGIGMPASMYLGTSAEDGQTALAEFLVTLAHERIHTWQHRRGRLFMQAGDAGHAQLVGLEPGFYRLANQGFMSGLPTAPELRSFAIYHAALDRYFADATRTWQTFFSDDAIDDYESGTAPLTDDADRQLLYSGVFEWIRRVHGEAGLAAVHAEVDALRIANGWTDFDDLPERSAEERNALFLEALIGGLEVDAADYFAHWKMPISASLQTYSDAFPLAPGTFDIDGDGFTPLEGDFDDGDPAVFPRATELLDGKDNNLDGQVDESVIVDTAAVDLPSTPSDNPASLPLALFGEIDDLADVDAVQFTLTERSLVTVILRAVDSDSTVINGAGKDVFTFVGQVTIDGTYTGQPNVAQLQHVALSRVLGAGTHSLRVSAAAFGSVPANPGEYVLQAFVNSFESPGMTGLDGAADFDYRLPSGLVTDPAFTCPGGPTASAAECGTLESVYQELGGDGWLDARGWLSATDVCSWRGVRCDDAGIDRLLLDEFARRSGERLVAEHLP